MNDTEKQLALISAAQLSDLLRDMILGNDRRCEWTDYGLKKNTTIQYILKAEHDDGRRLNDKDY